MAKTNKIPGSYTKPPSSSPAKNFSSKRRRSGKADHSSSVKKLKVGKDGRVPLVPADWQDDIITEGEGGDDCFWEEKEARTFHKHLILGVQHNFLFLSKEAKVDSRCSIRPSSVLKFRFEHGEFPLSDTKFGYSEWVPGWDGWVEKVLNSSAHRKNLSSAGVLDAVRVSSQLLIHREKNMQVSCAVSARWSTFSHTMVTAWGEFTFTLEDVRILLELPTLGREDISDVTLSGDERVAEKFFMKLFKELRTKSKVVRFSYWIALFYKKEIESAPPIYKDHKYELAVNHVAGSVRVSWLSR